MYPVTGVHGPLVIGHRGGGEEAPENTRAAFEALRALGVRHIETDAHITADSVVVINHDDTVDRTFDGEGRIREMDWDELKELRGPTGERMLTLAEALVEFPDMYFNIDAKTDAVAEPLVDVLVEVGALERTLVASFSEARLAHLRRKGIPALNTSLGTSAVVRLVAAAQCASDASRWNVPGPKQGVRAVQVPMRRGPIRVVDKRFVATAHRAGLAVHVWTVNEPEDMVRLIDLGVDGIVTDRPGLARVILQERGLWHEVPAAAPPSSIMPRD